MDERRKKAFDFASESTKQLITLATGIVALTITFAHDLLEEVSEPAICLLRAAWIMYLISIGFGIWTLLALTGELEPNPAQHEKTPSIRGANVTLPSLLQILAFVLGTTLVVAFGVFAA